MEPPSDPETKVATQDGEVEATEVALDLLEDEEVIADVLQLELGVRSPIQGRPRSFLLLLLMWWQPDEGVLQNHPAWWCRDDASLGLGSRRLTRRVNRGFAELGVPHPSHSQIASGG